MSFPLLKNFAGINKMPVLILIFYFLSQNIYPQTWTNLVNGAGSTASDYVLSLATDSSTNELYIGGTFTTVSGQPYQNIVKWNGSNYTNVGADGSVTAIAKLNGNIYASGSFATIGGTSANRMAFFNGSSWNPIGGGTNAPAYAFAWYGGMLYAGGSFSGINGFSTSANHLATWNGTTWSPVGAGIANGTTASGCCMSGDVNALCVYNGLLYVGGDFSKAGNVNTNCIAKWDGTTWSSVGGGIPTYVTSLVVYNNELYAGGNFTTAGGVTAHNIARWNGTSWAAVGPSTILNNPAWAMEVIANELYVAGSFSGVNTSGTSKFIAKWNGSTWNDVTIGPGTDNVSFAIAGVPTGWVYTGGGFFSADGNSNAVHIARLSIAATLPVELISFTAAPENNFIQLSWNTASEKDNSGFELQRSTDGNNFLDIKWIKGHGNSTTLTGYRYTDKNVEPETIYYYRLRQIDFNGNSNFSSTVSAKIGDADAFDFFISGNPAGPSTTVSWNLAEAGKVEILMTNLVGEKIHILKNANEIAGHHLFTFNKNDLNLSSGLYFITLINSSKSITRKMVVE
jgi:hypothetical protein